MLVSGIFLWSIVIVLSVIVLRKSSANYRRALQTFTTQGRRVAVRMPLALLAAGFIAVLIPQEIIGELIGGTSGLLGIATSSVLGSFIPGGPFITFPFVIALMNYGAGDPQMVAFIAAWSVIAIHRAIAWELPLMGARFWFIRFVSSAVLPPVCGVLAALLFAAFGSSS
jgi:uncharacterized membrane protein YraQ (UPF0718 family)